MGDVRAAAQPTTPRSPCHPLQQVDHLLLVVREAVGVELLGDGGACGLLMRFCQGRRGVLRPLEYLETPCSSGDEGMYDLDADGWAGRWLETYQRTAMTPALLRAWNGAAFKTQTFEPIQELWVTDRLHAITIANGNTYGGC